MNKNELALFGGPSVFKDEWPSTIIKSKKAKEYLAQAFDSGKWATDSDFKSESFERKFAKQFARLVDAKYCVPTTSGSSALRLALLALNIKQNDKVIVPGLTWVACASSVLSVGAIPVLVDIDPSDLCLSLSKTEEELKKGCSAIMLVHLYNSSAHHVERFSELAKKYNVPLIEDCAQSIGTKVLGKNVGNFGDVGCFSFHQSKELATGEGGAITTNNKDLFNRIELLRSDGMVFSGENKYYGRLTGHNMNMSEVHAAILCGQIEDFLVNQSVRVEGASFLEKLLSKEGFSIKKKNKEDTATSYFKFLISADKERFCGVPINIIAKALTSELKALITPIYLPLNKNILYNPLMYPSVDKSELLGLDKFDLSNAVMASENYICLHHNLLMAQKNNLKLVVSALLKIEENVEKLARYKLTESAVKRVSDFNQ